MVKVLVDEAILPMFRIPRKSLEEDGLTIDSGYRLSVYWINARN